MQTQTAAHGVFPAGVWQWKVMCVLVDLKHRTKPLLQAVTVN